MSIGLASPAVHAQTPITPPPPGLPSQIRPVDRDTQRVQKLAAELSLNQNQSLQILSIMRATHIRERAVRTATMLTPAQKQYRMRQVRLGQRAQIASVLTPPQRMRFMEIIR
jgi:Spy/CpxP family protein refolding chaperone